MIFGRLSGSLRARLLGTTLSAAAITLTALVALVLFRSGQTLSEQALEVSKWSETQLSDRLLSDARLAAARLGSQREDVGRRFATLAKRWDISKAVFSGNTVAASELLRPALNLADMDGVIAFDLHLRSITADRVVADLLAANSAIAETPFASALRSMLATNDADRARGFVQTLPWTDALAKALAADEEGLLADVYGQPVFDDFGEVMGGLVGFRVMRPEEHTLQAFAKLSGRDVLIVSGSKVLSSAGRDLSEVDFRDDLHSDLRSMVGEGKVARCIPFEAELRLCVAAPLRELELLAGKVVGIGEESSRSLLTTLCVAAGIALALVAFGSLVLSNRITRPLMRITQIVSEVARGNWHVAVPDVGRTDEVGDIARAVVVLEHSLAERDQLRKDVVRQNTALVEREGQLREQNEQFNAALNNMSQGLCMFDAGGHLKVFNEQFLAIYHLSPGTVDVGQDVQEVRQLTQIEMPANDAGRSSAVTATLPDGRYIEVSTQPMADGGWVETHDDVTESKAAQARISHLATHDALTGLPNRLVLAERLAEALADAGRTGKAASVLCLDLDDFKGVNDSLGHPAGDELLKKVGQRLLSVAPPDATVARLGGDEFAIVLSASDLPGEALRLAEDALSRLQQPFLIAGQIVATNASIGVATSLADISDGDDLLRRGDLALYAAKADSVQRVRLFEPAMEERLCQRRWLERELRDAIELGQIELHYQPLFGIASGEISGFEALARWSHPERGPISPAEFIPVAESTGLVNALGAYVLQLACAEAMKWPGNLRIAVNISPIQFQDQNLDRTVETVLRTTGLPSDRLELEITESVVLKNEQSTQDMLKRLRRLGVRFSMDDFGTGYSSLSSLNNFRFDKIKLDQSFVRSLMEKEESAAIVHVVAELGRSLKIATTAEGVETVEQLQYLRKSGFSEAQGYLFSRPIPAKDVAALISSTNKLSAAA